MFAFLFVVLTIFLVFRKEGFMERLIYSEGELRRGYDWNGISTDINIPYHLRMQEAEHHFHNTLT